MSGQSSKTEGVLALYIAWCILSFWAPDWGPLGDHPEGRTVWKVCDIEENAAMFRWKVYIIQYHDIIIFYYRMVRNGR